jgi:hypothetical protein
MRLVKIENNSHIRCYRLFDCIDCGDFYLLMEWDILNSGVVLLNQDTDLINFKDRLGGYSATPRFAKQLFMCIDQKIPPFNQKISMRS